MQSTTTVRIKRAAFCNVSMILYPIKGSVAFEFTNFQYPRTYITRKRTLSEKIASEILYYINHDRTT